VAAEKKQLPMIVRRFVSWRKRNGLSQRAAVEVMREREFELGVSVLQNWERGHRKPNRFAEMALSAFLDRYPTIPNPPRYKPGPK
jgi:DNA-binding transcriptional regulator YiaG